MLNSLLSRPTTIIMTSSRAFGKQVDHMRVVAQDRLGSAKELYVRHESKSFTGSEKDVFIKIHSSALNRADLLIRQGKYPGQKAPKPLGLEMAGVVEEVGGDVTKFAPGDRVMALLSGGGYSDFTLVNEDHLMRVPESVSLLHAGGIPEVWLTAYQLLHFVAKLQRGDKVLIHAGGSGVATAAIQLAKLAGAAQIIVTAGTDKKLEKALALGATTAINYKTNAEFSEIVLQATDNMGCDVILDCVGASYWKQNVASIARDGRWVLYGLMGGAAVDGHLLGMILGKRISLLGSTLMTRSDGYKTELISSFAQNALPHFKDPASPQLRPIIDQVFPLHSVVEAHEYMASNKSNGKILLNINCDDE